MKPMKDHRSRMHAPPIHRRTARVSLLLLASLLAVLGIVPANAQAITPTIVNGGRAIENNTTARESGQSANRMAVLPVVKHDPGLSVTGVRVDTDYNGTDESSTATLRAVTSQQPTIQGGFNYSRAYLSFNNTVSNIACGDRPGFSHTIYMRAVLSDGSVTPSVSKSVFFTPAGGCTGYTDYPFIYNQLPVAPVSLNVGQSASFTFQGDSPDSGDNFDGYSWRLRRINDDAVTAETLVCTSAADNSTHTITPTFNRRGHWVLEAELRGDGCSNRAGTAGRYWRIGAADVNTPQTASPSLSLSATRPQLNGTTTITAATDDADDSAEGGAVQAIEWDLDNNAATGVGGYEDSTLGTGTLTGAGQTSNTLTAAEKVNTINTTGKAPGTYTVRARVTDNGAINAADSIRRQTTATTTYTVDSPPVAANQTVSTETAEAKAITLSATDANNDALTYTIVSGPSNGTLTGTGANRTYTSNANFAGTDSFVFKADDGFGGTSNGTVTINVAPQTQIDSGPSGTTGPNPSFEFSSPVSGASFECSLDTAAFTPCSSPKDYTGLSGGQHTFQVRAIAAGFTDPTPASRTFTVDATPPETTIDSGPAGPTLDSTPEFTFSSSEAGSTFECRVDAGAFQGCTSPHATEPLSFGSHTFEVRATDPYGNVDPTPASRAFVVLNAAEPETTINSGPSGRTDDPTPTFEFSSSIPGSSFECRIDGGTFTACTSPHTTEPLNEGQHTFEVRAISPAGNEDPTPATRDFVVDTVAPETTITDGPGNLTNDSTPTFRFTSDEAGSTFECSLDAGNFTPCESPYTTTPLDDGQHTFEVRATDPTGITDQSPASRTFTVDATDPETTIDSGPSGLTNDPTPTFGFSSDEAGATFQCRIDAAAFTSCDSPKTYGTLADGQHTFEVRATDPAGNTDGSPASRTFTIDATDPQTTIDSGPANPTNDRTPTFEFSSSQPGSSFECSLDGAAFATCTSPETTASLSDGQHTFEVRATDPAGNTDQSPASRTFTVDATAPQTTIDSGPSQDERIKDATPTFSFSSNENGATFECSVDGAPFASCESPLTTDQLADGTHAFAVRATDGAGNVDGSPASRSFMVDTVAPETTIDSGPSGITGDSTATFAFSSPDPSPSFECRFDGDAFSSCGSPHTSGSLDDGEHTFYVRALDEAGNADESPASRTFIVDTADPQTAIDSGPSDLTNDRTPTFEFSSDEASSTFQCRLDGGSFSGCSSPHTTGQLADGSHTFEVRATDPAGNTDASPATWTFTVDATEPRTTIESGPSEGQRINETRPQFAFRSDEPGSTFECRVDADAFAACDSPYTTAPLADGQHTFEVRATDAAGNVEEPPAARTFAVDVAAPETSIDSGPEGQTNERRPSFGFSSSEPDSTFKCRMDADAFQPCDSPFRPEANLSEGSHTFEVRATDAATNPDPTPASRSFTVDVDVPTTAITFGPASTTTDTTPTFQFASDTSDARFECRIDSNAGADFFDCDSPYTLDELDEGPHNFEVRAIDQAGNADPTPASRTFTVAREPDTVIESGPREATNDPTPTFEFSSSKPKSSFECRLDSTSSADFASCDSPFTTDPLDDGRHTLDVRAVDQYDTRDRSPASRTFTVDTAAPNTKITAEPGDSTSDRTPTWEFESSEEGSSFECRMDDGAFALCDSPYTAETLSDGPHRFAVRAIDAVGNADPAPATSTFTVDSSRASAKAFSLGKVKLNRDKGTATLAVHLPEAGKVSLGGRGIRGRSKLIPSARTVKLRILAKGRRARRLEERGSVSVRAKVTFNPDDGPPATKSKRVKLHKRR